MSSSDQVRDYYDANTRSFLRHGQGGRTASIHRAVWGEGARTREEAMRWVEDKIAQRLGATNGAGAAIEPIAANGAGAATASAVPRQFLDLGCGVGGSMLYLCKLLDASFYGLTISPVQAVEGQRRLAQAGMAERCEIRTGSFLDPLALEAAAAAAATRAGALRRSGEPAQPPEAVSAKRALATSADDKRQHEARGTREAAFHGAYAIESFIHSDGRAREFFAAVSAVLRASARLVIVDDFLLVSRAKLPLPDARALSEFEQHWRARPLEMGGVREAASEAGLDFEEELVLDDKLELGRPRDHCIRCLVPFLRLGGQAFRQRPFIGNLLGGSALQHCLRRGVLGYRLLVFRKRY